MALQHQVPPHVLRAEEKRLGVRLLGAQREIFYTRSVQVTAPTNILGGKLPVSVVPADIDNPQDADPYLDRMPPTAMLARFLLNSTDPLTLSHLWSHDILLPVAGHPDTERKHDAGRMVVQVDTGGRDMSLISHTLTRDKTLALRRAPPLCRGLRVRCMGGAPSSKRSPTQACFSDASGITTSNEAGKAEVVPIKIRFSLVSVFVGLGLECCLAASRRNTKR